MIKPVFTTMDENRTIVEIAIPSSKLNGVRDVLHLIGVPEATPSGIGWQYADGGMIIIGSESAVRSAAEKISYYLDGPKFRTALEIAGRS